MNIDHTTIGSNSPTQSALFSIDGYAPVGALERMFHYRYSAVYEGAPRASENLPRDIEIKGRDALVDGVRTLMTGAKSIHQGYMPEIELTSATTARAVWSMFDDVRLPTCHFKGWGHYHEDYVKEDGQWKLKKIHLTRLHTEEEWV